MRSLLVTLIGILVAVSILGGTSLAQSKPEFRLGFKALAEQIPGVVGEPLEEEHFGPNGDSLQRTSKGLMAWRKADNWTAFTDGSRTWVNGPSGVQDRPNDERFEWEAPAPAAPEPAPTSTPVPTPIPASPPPAQPSPAPTPVVTGPFTPDMKAMDPQNAGPGAALKQLLLEVDGEWAGAWGWRPRKPVTVYLYADANAMAGEALRLAGGSIPEGDRDSIAREEAWAQVDRDGRGMTVLLAVNGASWGNAWERMKARHNLLHHYAHIMVWDFGSRGLPIWFLEGIAEYVAFAKDPQAVAAFGRVTAATALFNLSQLPGGNPAAFPSLRQLSTPSQAAPSWATMVASGEAGKRSALGIAYLAVKHLVDRVGTQKVAQVLAATAGEEPFDAALERVTGYSVERLDAEYRTTISRAGWTR